MDQDFLIIENWLPMSEANRIADRIESINDWQIWISDLSEIPSSIGLPESTDEGCQRNRQTDFPLFTRPGPPAHRFFARGLNKSGPTICRDFERKLIAPVGDDLMLMGDIHASMFMTDCYIAEHRDSGYGRQISFTFNLTRDWNPAWGGCLTIWSSGKWHLVEPQFNMLVLINTQADTCHFVSRVEPEVTRKRIAITGWLAASGNGS